MAADDGARPGCADIIALRTIGRPGERRDDRHQGHHLEDRPAHALPHQGTGPGRHRRRGRRRGRSRSRRLGPGKSPRPRQRREAARHEDATVGVASRRPRRSPMARRRCRGRRLLHGLRLDHQRATRHDDPQDVPAVPRRRPLAVGRDAVDAHRAVHPRRHGLWNADRSRRRTVLVRRRTGPPRPAGALRQRRRVIRHRRPGPRVARPAPDSRAAARRHGHRRHRRPCLRLRRQLRQVRADGGRQLPRRTPRLRRRIRARSRRSPVEEAARRAIPDPGMESSPVRRPLRHNRRRRPELPGRARLRLRAQRGPTSSRQTSTSSYSIPSRRRTRPCRRRFRPT